MDGQDSKKGVMLEQIRRYGVVDERVLAAMAGVDREKFVPYEYRQLAYDDRPLPIGYGQTISQPYTVARMIELLVQDSLFVAEKAKALEVGTGSGYQTAILALIFGLVYSVEIVRELSREAERNMRKLGIGNFKLQVGDGKKGWMKYAPYEAIIVAANAGEIPTALVGQLKAGGRMVIPVLGEMMRITKLQSGKVTEEKFGEFNFVPLV